MADTRVCAEGYSPRNVVQQDETLYCDKVTFNQEKHTKTTETTSILPDGHASWYFPVVQTGIGQGGTVTALNRNWTLTNPR